MRTLHNILRRFKKDDGAHFTYNLGVSFLRLSVVVFIVGLVALFFSFMLPSVGLTYGGKVMARVDSTKCDWVRVSMSDRWDYTYGVGFICEFVDRRKGTDTFYCTQATTKRLYDKYHGMEGGDKLVYNIYYSLNGGSYITKKRWLFAAIEYCSSNLRYGYSSLYMISYTIMFASVVPLVIGIHQQQVSMKYPRSDVPDGINTNALQEIETEELMKEFDEAYARYNAKKKFGFYVGDDEQKLLPDKNDDSW